MSQTKRSRKSRGLFPVHPAAAAIDVGAALHVAAVGADRDKEPVRTFRNFTDDLHRLADWSAQCGIRTIVMKSTGVYWIPVFEILEQRGFECDGGQRAGREACAWAEDAPIRPLPRRLQAQKSLKKFLRTQTAEAGLARLRSPNDH
jgi:hypothetical protein